MTDATAPRVPIADAWKNIAYDPARNESFADLEQAAAQISAAIAASGMVERMEEVAEQFTEIIRRSDLLASVDRTARELSAWLQDRPELREQWALALKPTRTSSGRGRAEGHAGVAEVSATASSPTAAAVHGPGLSLPEVTARLTPEDLRALTEAMREPLAEARAAAARGGLNGWAERNPGWVLVITVIVGLISPVRDQVEWMWDDPPPSAPAIVQPAVPPGQPEGPDHRPL